MTVLQAVYSSVSVYEMEVNGVAVMRRRSDSWLNATQILKVAGIDKGKRTKVLEKEILAGEHEKVQGGYGKYQGTWINYRRGREFCHQYGVEELLRPLLEHDMGQDGVTQAGQGGTETPTKEQAMAAQRKRNMYNGGSESRPSAQSPSQTFFKNISATAANAVSAMGKARFDSPAPRPASRNKRATPVRRPSQQPLGNQESVFPGSSQQSLQSLHSEGSFGINGQLEPAFAAHPTPYFTNVHQQNSNNDAQEPPRKRIRPSSSQDMYSRTMNPSFDVSVREASPTELSESFMYHQHGLSHSTLDRAMIRVEPLPQPVDSSPEQQKMNMLAALFIEPPLPDLSMYPAMRKLSGDELDIPIDPTAHTAVHWAATLAKTSLLRALISKGASLYRVNSGGETALMRAVLTTNNLDQSSFPELLELLGPSIEMRDGRGRTVLHHIAVQSAVKGRSTACKYYLESLLEFVIRQGSASSSQQESFQSIPDSSSQSKPKSIGLARFMSEIVNATDKSGDTALNLVARIGNKGIIAQLIEIGANPGIPNCGGLKPTDFGIGGDPEPSNLFHSSQTPRATHEKTGTAKIGDSSRDLMSCKCFEILTVYNGSERLLTLLNIAIQTLLTDTESSFRSELQVKQAQIDEAHTQLRESTKFLSEERRHLEDLQNRADERKDLKQQIINLKRANEEQKQRITHRRSSSGANSTSQIRMDVKIGDADAGLEINPDLLPPMTPSQQLQISPQQHAYLSTLQPTHILNARVAAYKAHNAGLQQEISQLQTRSVDLEKGLRRAVALCTRESEDKVDGLAANLMVAVESERGEEVQVNRVREFLRKVEVE